MTNKTNKYNYSLLFFPDQKVGKSKMAFLQHKLLARGFVDFRDSDRSLLHRDDTLLVHDFFSTADRDDQLFLGFYLDGFPEDDKTLTIQDFAKGKHDQSGKLEDLFFLSASRKILCCIVVPDEIKIITKKLPMFQRRSDQSIAVVFIHCHADSGLGNLTSELFSILMKFMTSNHTHLDKAYLDTFYYYSDDYFPFLQNFGAFEISVGSCEIQCLDEYRPPIRKNRQGVDALKLENLERHTLERSRMDWQLATPAMPLPPAELNSPKPEIQLLKTTKEKTLLHELDKLGRQLQVVIKQVHQGNASGALQNLLEVIENLKEIQDPGEVVHRMLFFALLWYGNLWLNRKNYDSALLAWEEAISVQERYAGGQYYSQEQSLFIYDALSYIYFKKDNFDAMEFFIEEKFKLLEKLPDHDGPLKTIYLNTQCQILILLLKNAEIAKALTMSSQLLQAFFSGEHELPSHWQVFQLVWSLYTEAASRCRNIDGWLEASTAKAGLLNSLAPLTESTWQEELFTDTEIERSIGWVFHEIPNRFMDPDNQQRIQTIRRKFVESPCPPALQQKMLNWAFHVGYFYLRNQQLERAHEFFEIARKHLTEFQLDPRTMEHVFVLFYEFAGAAAHTSGDAYAAFFWSKREYDYFSTDNQEPGKLASCLYRWLYSSIRVQNQNGIETAVSAASPLLELPVYPDVYEVDPLLLCKLYLLCTKQLQEKDRDVNTRLIRLNNERILRVTEDPKYSLQEVASLYLQFYQNFLTSTRGAAFLSLKRLLNRYCTKKDPSDQREECFLIMMKTGILIQYMIALVHPSYYVLFSNIVHVIRMVESPRQDQFHLLEYYFLSMYYLEKKNQEQVLPQALRKYLSLDSQLLLQKCTLKDRTLVRPELFEAIHKLIDSHVESRSFNRQEELYRVIFSACFLASMNPSEDDLLSQLAIAVERIPEQNLKYGINKQIAKLLHEWTPINPKKFIPEFVRSVKNLMEASQYVADRSPFMELLLFHENQLFDPKRPISDNTIISTQWRLVDLYFQNNDINRANRIFDLNVKNITTCFNKPQLEILELVNQIGECKSRLDKFKPLQKESRSSLQVLARVFREKVFVESSPSPPLHILNEAYRMILMIEIHLDEPKDVWELLEKDLARWFHLGYNYFHVFSSLVLDISQKSSQMERNPENGDPHIDFILKAFPIILKNTQDPRCGEVFIKEAFFRTHDDKCFSTYRDIKLDELLQQHINNSIWNENVILILSYLHKRNYRLVHPEIVARYSLELLKKALGAVRDPETGEVMNRFEQYPDGALYEPNILALAAIYSQYHSWCFDGNILGFLSKYQYRFKEKTKNLKLDDGVKKYVIFALDLLPM